jgi:hypothetical protein
MTFCCQPVNPLPITTGRVGLSQTTGQVTFYNPPHVWIAQTKCWVSPQPYPGWPVAQRWGPGVPQSGLPWGQRGWGSCGCGGGCGCGGSCGGGGGCGDSCACFIYLLTNPEPWYCYWNSQQANKILANPAALAAANAVLAATPAAA